MVLDIDTTFSALYTHAIRHYVHVLSRAAWLVNLYVYQIFNTILLVVAQRGRVG